MNNNSPLISIALCTYNGAVFIREQLDSIFNQTYPNLELVIIDDHSTDDTVDILRSYQTKFQNITLYVNDANLGVNKSFSKAINLCNGEFIAISDQDDIWLPNRIENSYRYIGNNTLLYSNSLLIDESGNDLHRRMFRNSEFYSGDDPRILSFYNNIAGHTILFKSDIKKDILPIPECSHYDWWIAFVSANHRGIIYLDIPLVMHRIHSNNISGALSLIRQDKYKAVLRWTKTMLSVQNLKHRFFFEELYSILNINNSTIKKMRLLLFQLKYSNLLFYNKSFFSTIYRARRFRFPYIPGDNLST